MKNSHSFRLAMLICLCAAFILGAPAQTNKNIKRLQSQQTELKKQISESEQLLRSTKKDVKSQLGNLEIISGQINEKQKFVDGIKLEVDTLLDNIKALQKELTGLQADLAECKSKYHRSVMYMYRNRMTHNKLMFIFSAKDFHQMYRRTRYVMEYSKYQRAQGEILKEKQNAVRKKQKELQAVKDLKDRMLADGKQEQEKLEAQKKEQQVMINELNKKTSQLQATLKKQKKKANELNARIEKLIQEEIAAAERRRKAEEERRRKAAAAAKKKGQAQTGKGGKTATPKFTPQSDADVVLSKNFAANKGRLPMPITGGYIISSRYGQYNVDGLRGVTLDNKGINITGRKGAQARSIFDGEVTAVFQFGGLYNIIIRHGSYISVYCNLSSTSVRQGQKVTTRQTLGTIAPDASGNCTLHFQLRKETTKYNPEHWLGR